MKFFNKNINKVLSVVLVVVSVLVVLQFVCSNGTLNAGETPTESAMARVNPNIRKIVPRLWILRDVKSRAPRCLC